MPLSIPEEELMDPGHTACHGCGAALAMRYMLKALGRETVVSVPASCWAVIPGALPYKSLEVPMIFTPFAATGASITGIRESLDIQGKQEYNVVGFAGDGGTADIGLQSLSGAMERGHNVFYIMYDNEAYMNTGVQRSSSTPFGASTTTTPLGKNRNYKKQRKKFVADLMIAQGVPYVATASIAFPEDMIRKLKNARKMEGPKFMQIFTPCPTGWYYPPEETIEIARLAVRSKVFPLYESIDGKMRLSKPSQIIPVSDYLSRQKRFSHLESKEVEQIQNGIEERWNELASLENEGAK